MDYFAIIESAAQSGCLGVNGMKAPTEAQKNAGNYRMGRCEYKGLQLVFEQPRNSYREGTAKDGKKWRNRMAAHYGYLAGTKGADGDGVDIFVGPNPETDNIFVINQVDPATGQFDEHKVMLAFIGPDDAKRAYQESYDADWRGFGDMVSLTLDQFKWWLKYGATTKPISRKSLPYDGSLDMNEIQWDSAALPVNTDLAGLMYQLRIEDTDGLMLDSVTVADILEDAESVLTLDALVVPVNMLDRKAKQLQNIMSMAGGSLTVSAMQLTAPFKNRGTTNIAAVYELSDGQTVSIFFHNPDSTPNKLAPTDDLVSWKWLLNKKDITLLVAPEKGLDLNPREVARRVMRLAEKNSARFTKANEGRAARMANIAGLKQQVDTKAATLKGIEDEIEQVQAKLEDPTRAPAPGNSEAVTSLPADAEQSATQEDESTIGFTAEDVANFGAVEAARRAAWFEKYGYENHKNDPAFIALKSYLLKQFGTDNISDFSGGLVNGVKPLDAALAYVDEPTDQDLYVHNQTREGHNLLKALLGLGWKNESQSTKNKALWYVSRTILGGFKGSVNPEGKRSLTVRLEDGQMKAEHGDKVLVSVPYDASKTPEGNAQAFNAAVDAIPGSGVAAPVQSASIEEVNFKIMGKDRIYNAGKTFTWNSDNNRYMSGTGSKAVPLKKSELEDIEVDYFALLKALGNVNITSIGGENVYFEKDGVPYYTKLLVTEQWSEGPADFSVISYSGSRPAAENSNGIDSVDGLDIESGPFAGFNLVAQSALGIKSDMVNVKGLDGTVIGKVSRNDVAAFIGGSTSVFTPSDDWKTKFSNELKAKLGLSEPVAVQEQPIDEEQARYSAFSASELKMPTPPQLGVGKPVTGGTGFRLLSGGTGWTNGNVVDLGKLSPAMQKAVEQKYEANSAPTIDTDRVNALVNKHKSNRIQLKPVAFTTDRILNNTVEGGGKFKDVESVILTDSDDEKIIIPVDKKLFAYFYRKYPGADFVGNSAADPILVKKAGEVVGLIAPMRTSADLKRALKARDTNQQKAAEPVVMSKKTPADVDAMISSLDLNTAEGFARAMQILVAKKRYEDGIKYNTEQVENGRMSRDQSFVDAAVLAQNFNEQVMQNGASFMPVAEAFASKNPLPLIYYFVKNNYESGERVFQMATGIKLLGLNKQKKTEAIYKWAGWTDEQIADFNAKVEAAEAEGAAAAEQKTKEDALRSAWNRAGDARVSDNGSIISFADYVLKRAQNGFNQIEREKKGATYKYSITNGDTWSSINSPAFNGLLKAMSEYGGVIESLKFLGAMPTEQAPASNPDRDYLNQVIAGQVDFMAPEVADQLVAIAEKYTGDSEMSALAEQAAEAYSAAVVQAAQAALGVQQPKKPDADIANAKSPDYDVANANQEGAAMSSNGKISVGQLVQYKDSKALWKVINVTDKRIVAKEAGSLIEYGENNDAGVLLRSSLGATKSMVASSLLPVDGNLKVFREGDTIPKTKWQLDKDAQNAKLAADSKSKQDAKIKQVKKDYPSVIKAFELYPAYDIAYRKHESAEDAIESHKLEAPSYDDESEAAGDYRQKLGELERELNQAKAELDKVEKAFMKAAAKVANETKELIKAEKNKDMDYLFKISNEMGVNAAVYDFLV